MDENNKGIAFRENLRKYFAFARPYWTYYLLIIFFVLLVSLSGIAEKFLFKIIIDDGTNFASGVLSKDAFISILFWVAFVFGVTIIIRGLSHWARYFFINRLEGELIFDLKKKFFNHILRLSHKFHTTHRTGSLIAKMSRGARSIESITDFFVFSSIPLITELIVVCISLAYFELSSVAVILATMVVFVVFVVVVTRLQQKPKIESNDADDAEKAFVGDIFTNVDSIKYFGKEARVSNLFEFLAKKSSKTLVKTWDFESYVEIGQSIIFGVGVALLLYFPLIRFINGEITIGSLAFIYTIYFNVAMPMFSFMFGFRNFYAALADFQSLGDYEKINNDVPDKTGAKRISVKKGAIEFKDISFTYHKKKVIENFSIKINPKEKVAFVGLSGSGKTTLVKLLYRLYDVDSGKILIDGINVSDVLQESLRSELSIVPQECVLFNDTIYNNLIFSNPSASKEDVIGALKVAQMHDFVQSLPEKENTIVGERGIKLSGGEKQRISIARAILADKKILVLDEATSALDSQTEHQIQKALESLMKGRTTIVIAHRLSTILEADRIVVIDKGKIAQQGTHSQLIKQEGIYKKLWNMQKGGYIEE